MAAALTAAIVSHMEPIFAVSDAQYYVSIARGDTAHVMQPWAFRQLGALVVAGLAHVMHGSIEGSFIVEGGLSLLVTLGTVYWLMLRTAAPRWMLIAVAVLPSWVQLVQYLALPDLWYAALLSVLFLLLSAERWTGAALMMFPLMLSRESTSLTLLCFLVAGRRQLRWMHWVLAVVATAAGSLIVSHLTAQSQPNMEHLPPTVYMILKVPWNFLHNVLGVVPWSNVNTDLCTVPFWSVPIHYGDVQRIGVCGFSWSQQIVACQVIFTSFGLLPLMTGFLWWRHRRTQGRSLLLSFSLLYGAACLFLAPVLGAGVQHLVGYAWPLFLIALPLLFNEFSEGQGLSALSHKQALASASFFALHLAACADSYWRSLWPKIIGAAVLWAAGLLLLRQMFPAPAPDAHELPQ